MSIKRVLIAMAATLGLGGQHAASVAAPPSQAQARQIAAVKNGQTTRSIEADLFGSYSGGLGRGFLRSAGHTPYEWGVSRACQRMHRKNRMRSLGIRGSRI